MWATSNTTERQRLAFSLGKIKIMLQNLHVQNSNDFSTVTAKLTVPPLVEFYLSDDDESWSLSLNARTLFLFFIRSFKYSCQFVTLMLFLHLVGSNLNEILHHPVGVWIVANIFACTVHHLLNLEKTKIRTLCFEKLLNNVYNISTHPWFLSLSKKTINMRQTIFSTTYKKLY